MCVLSHFLLSPLQQIILYMIMPGTAPVAAIVKQYLLICNVRVIKTINKHSRHLLLLEKQIGGNPKKNDQKSKSFRFNQGGSMELPFQ